MSTAASSSVPPPIDPDPQLDESIKELLPSLPSERWFGSTYLYKYNGFWLSSPQLAGLIAFQNKFQARDTDVVLITYPKSGTTWLKALMFTLANRNIYPINQNHPLLNQNPHSLVPFMDFLSSPVKLKPNQDFSSCPPGIRLYATHSPICLPPDSVLNSDSKMIYLCRNPKDVFVSYWHFTEHLGSSQICFEEFFDLFCKGVSYCGPIWNHVLDYWKASLEKPRNVLFLRYEGLTQEPASYLKLLAGFMGCPISQEEETTGPVDEILRLCSFDCLKNLEVNKSGSWWIASNPSYFRKGKVGDWKYYLTSEMAERVDQIIAQKFQGSGLSM